MFLTEDMQKLLATLLTDDRLNGTGRWLAFSPSWPRNQPGVRVLLNFPSSECAGAREAISTLAGSHNLTPEFVSLPACFERGVRQAQSDQFQILLTCRPRTSLESAAEAIHAVVARFDLTGLRLDLREAAPELAKDLRVVIAAKDCATPATALTCLRDQVQTAVSWTPAGRRGAFLLGRDAAREGIRLISAHLDSLDPEHLPDNPGVRLEAGRVHVWCDGASLDASQKLAGRHHEAVNALAADGAATETSGWPE
jgi:hypothetical protein